ncbi:MAG: protein-tyrosine phosphatase [Gammaproteobacteria bacterium]|jgi:protein-tyrosine phosphatase
MLGFRKPAAPPSGLVDIHSHILPCVDDGAKSLSDALAMLRLAATGGVGLQVLTPHIGRRYPNRKKDLEERFDAFRSESQAAGIDIELRLSAEVSIGSEIVELVEQDAIPWLGELRGQRTFLLELPNSLVPSGSINLVAWLRRHDLLPIIVHPERNRAFQESPDNLKQFTDIGCPVQITAGSLLGRFGRPAKLAAREMLKGGAVTVIASDCHNQGKRRPDLADGMRAATRLIGELEARSLVTQNPTALLGGHSPDLTIVKE